MRVKKKNLATKIKIPIESTTLGRLIDRINAWRKDERYWTGC